VSSEISLDGLPDPGVAGVGVPGDVSHFVRFSLLSFPLSTRQFLIFPLGLISYSQTYGKTYDPPLSSKQLLPTLFIKI